MCGPDSFVVDGVVIESLAPTVVQVELRNGHRLLAHVIRRERSLIERFEFRAGDQVWVALSPFDLTEGRLILQEQDKHESPGFREKDVRELQDHPPQRGDPGDLHQRPPQTAAGLNDIIG